MPISLPSDWRFPKSLAFVALLGSLTIASFIYAIFAHDADQATAYYNSFARAWELLLGALVGAVVPYVRWPMWLRTSVAVVALAAILFTGSLIGWVSAAVDRHKAPRSLARSWIKKSSPLRMAPLAWLASVVLPLPSTIKRPGMPSKALRSVGPNIAGLAQAFNSLS